MGSASDGTDASVAPPESIKAIPVRHWGRWVSAVVVLGALGALALAIARTREFDFSAIPDYQFNDTIIRGLRATIVLSVLAQLIGVVLGIVLAVMRLSKNPVLSATSWLYIWFFRGTPVLVQLLFWFNIGLVFSRVTIGVPFTHYALVDVSTNDLISGFTAALLGLGLNEGAYMAEIVRAGIISVDHGQTEAAHALGMTQSQTMRRVVL
ncbi:MAG: amino acid ABC transporter permease, partial [Mycobacteriales bacterium]